MRAKTWQRKHFIGVRLIEQQRQIDDLKRQVEWLRQRCFQLRRQDAADYGEDMEQAALDEADFHRLHRVVAP